MSDGKKIKVILHRGAEQIGGVCTEISTNEARIFFDFGSPLEGEGNQEKLDIEGLTYGNIHCNAVFITHYHGDHVGEVPGILPGIPIYMEKTAKKILQAQQEHKISVGQIVWAKDIYDLCVGTPITIKDLKITPLASDHSASDSIMYLVEGQDKRILLTGDYRLHGFCGDRLEDTFSSLGHIDLMITEGTNINRESPYCHDEKWVEEQFKRILRENKYVFLLASSSNIDRIASFSRAIPRGKHGLSDKYQKKLMNIADVDREDGLKSKRIWPYDADKKSDYEQRGFGMVVRTGDSFSSLVKEYFEKYPDDTCLIYSMWKGYRTIPSVAELLECCQKIETIHVSGHITKEDLEHVIELVKPDRLIIHHTASDEKEKDMLEIPNGTQILTPKDGEVISV